MSKLVPFYPADAHRSARPHVMACLGLAAIALFVLSFSGFAEAGWLTKVMGAAEGLFAEVRSSLVVELAERKSFEEAVWQLARPLNKANVRVLALEPGGPPRLASAPRVDPATKRALVDTIDPASLSAALGAVRGQTVLITGRVDG